MASTVLWASIANAQAGDAALAETLFREGKRLMKAGKYDEACPKLAESNRIDAGTGTLLALAFCHEQQGKTATAWAEYNEVVSAADRQRSTDRGHVARGRIAALEPQLSRLTVVVGPSAARLPGLQVTRDGVPLGEVTWGSAVPVDPGDHEVQATADRKKVLLKSVHIDPRGDRQTVTISTLDDEASLPPPETSPTPPAPQTRVSTEGAQVRDGVAPSPPPVVHRPVPVSVYVLGGVGALALGSFGYFGLAGRSEYFDLKGACGPDCTKSMVSSAHTKLLVADVSLGVSLIALGSAAYLFLTRPSTAEGTAVGARPVRVDVRTGPHGAEASFGLVF
jgi:hypothetical protein